MSTKSRHARSELRKEVRSLQHWPISYCTSWIENWKREGTGRSGMLMTFCKSRKAAERTLNHIKPFIEKKLFLQLNDQKTKIRHIASADVKFLGFGFWADRGGVIKARPHKKSKDKCKARLKALTNRNRGQSLDTFRDKLTEFIRGGEQTNG